MRHQTDRQTDADHRIMPPRRGHNNGHSCTERFCSHESRAVRKIGTNENAVTIIHCSNECGMLLLG